MTTNATTCALYSRVSTGAQHCENQHAELERYAAALSDPRGVKLGLYFPLLAGWRDWEKKHSP